MSNPFSPYGLASNPWGLPRLRSFDPAEEKAEPFWVDGFRALQSPGPLHAFFKSRREAKKPAPVLVRGKSGIGRTAAARHILRKYGNAAGAARMVAPVIEVNSDPLSVVKSWLRKLGSELSGSLEVDEKKYIGELLRGPTLDEGYLFQFDEFLGNIDKRLGATDNTIVAMGFCLDDPPEKFPCTTLIQKIFANANIAVVLVIHTELDEEQDQTPVVAQDPLLALFQDLANSNEGWIFPRAKLTAEDAYILAEAYWKQACADAPCPVEADAIQKLWADSPLALADVLQVLATALHRKGASASGTAWPDPALCISGSDLCAVRSILATGQLYNKQDGPRWKRAGQVS